MGDIVQAHEAYGLLRVIGQHSDALMRSPFDFLFAALDRVLLNQYMLSIARIYEKPPRQYDIRSIPAALQLLEEERERFPIRERYALERRLSHAGYRGDLARLSDKDLTEEVLAFFRQRMPSAKSEASDELSVALRGVRARRDKAVAHNEVAERGVFPEVTWAQAESLVRFAEGFLAVVSFGYLSLALTDDEGHFFLGDDAGRAPMGLEKLLQEAGLISRRGAV